MTKGRCRGIESQGAHRVQWRQARLFQMHHRQEQRSQPMQVDTCRQLICRQIEKGAE